MYEVSYMAGLPPFTCDYIANPAGQFTYAEIGEGPARMEAFIFSANWHVLRQPASLLFF